MRPIEPDSSGRWVFQDHVELQQVAGVKDPLGCKSMQWWKNNCQGAMEEVRLRWVAAMERGDISRASAVTFLRYQGYKMYPTLRSTTIEYMPHTGLAKLVCNGYKFSKAEQVRIKPRIINTYKENPNYHKIEGIPDA